jgi:protein tyrosine/serine phosphatase
VARAGHWVYVEHRLREIAPGVYQSGAFSPEELPAVVERHGFRTVVDLRKWDEGDVAAEASALQASGVRHVHLPFDDVPDAGTLDAFLDLMSEPESYPVLIHCKHGWGRSRLLAAIYRIEFEGWDVERARRATRWLTTESTSFDEDEPKGRFLLDYTPLFEKSLR